MTAGAPEGSASPVRNSSLYALGQLASKGSFLVSMMLYSRYLADDSFGALLLCISIGQIFFFMADMGVSLLVNRTISTVRDGMRPLIGVSLDLRLAMSAASFVLVTAFAIAAFPGVVRSGMLPLILLFHALEAFSELGFSVFRALERGAAECSARIASGLVSVAGAGLVSLLDLGPIAASSVYVARGAVGLALVLAAMSRGGLLGGEPSSDRLSRARILLGRAVPLGLLGMAMVLHQRVDSLYLGGILGETAVGAFQECYRLLDSLVLIITPTLLPGALFPGLCRAFREGGEALRGRFRRISALVGMLSVTIASTLLSAGLELPGLVWGGDFLRSIPRGEFLLCYNLVSTSIVPVFHMNFLLASMLAAGLERRALLVSLAGLAALTAVDLYAIPRIGTAGAALGLLVSSVVLCAGMLAGLSRTGRLGFAGSLLRPTAVALVSALVHFTLSGVLPWLPRSLAVLASGAGMMLLDMRLHKDWWRFLHERTVLRDESCEVRGPSPHDM